MKLLKSCLLLLPFLVFSAVAAPAETSCTKCHGDPEFLGEEAAQVVTDFAKGVHAAVGLSCHDCHGGNPALEHAEDMDAAMDSNFRENRYIGSPMRTEIPSRCGSCHSDPAYMRTFRPDARVDIEQEYWTSQHGIALKSGDTAVATCTDCHGVHGILRVNEVTAPVYATNVAKTCSTCHSDAEKMAGRTTPSGSPIPINQFALWEVSVHAKALLEKNDLFAPTCNDCHGNHGATPPGLASISFVCGQCHGREAELFRDSAKHDGFLAHNEFLADAGAGQCEMCHEFESVPPFLENLASFSECTSCHGNHAVLRPTTAMLSPLPDSPCAFCHEQVVDEAEPVTLEIPARYEEMKQTLFQEAASLQLEGNARFDWLVDQALLLPMHTQLAGTEESARLRPEFARLFEKFRIGPTTYTFSDPTTGEAVTRDVIRCETCHQVGEEGSESAVMSQHYLDRIRELTATTATAERLLLRAKRGGVETREALTEIDEAVDTQIGLQVLVHSFSVDKESQFIEKQQEGLERSSRALQIAEAAIQELQFRRVGLGVSLIFILLVLVGLWLKIRQLG
ncbi:MAG: cytochrome c3 family protein [Acidobacteriota bacterium]|nr:MAG: cytochrome c3 family protein [Acidobacteriota bacterium]